MSSLQQKQISALKHMLSLNSGGNGSSFGSETVFSVLIYDRHGQDIISPLLSVNQLREMGVTLHMLLHSQRDEIPDVPAIYFCQPTEENLIRIGQDFSDGLYSSYYLNFTSPISRQKMEDLAQTSLQSNCQSAIKKVYDQYVNFICLEDDMFCLKHQGEESLNYYALNRGDIQDSEIESIIDSIVDSLFSVFVNMGQIPIIRSQRGNAAEMVSERLDRKLRENLRDPRNSFFAGMGADAFATGQLSFQRPLLVVLDRNADLSTPLHHTWTYQALAHDLLDLSLNRVSISTDEEGGKRKKKDYELSDADHFWAEHKGSAFPTVAAAVETALEDYKSNEGRVKGLRETPMDQGGFDPLAEGTAALTTAMTSLPELIKAKANIDKHMSIAMALLSSIKDRKLDVYFETEEKVMARAALDKPVIELLRNNEVGSAADKLRLFLIYYLCSSEISPAELKEATEVLEEAGADLRPLTYVKRWKSLMKMTSVGPSEYTGGVASTVSMFSKLLNHGSAIVVEGVKNFVLKENKLPITRIIDNLMEVRSCEEDKEFLYLDPKMMRPSVDITPAPNARSKTPFQDAVVFVVGGGTYTEYTNLRLCARNKASQNPRRRMIYGCTDVVNAQQFLAQLAKLGSTIS